MVNTKKFKHVIIKEVWSHSNFVQKNYKHLHFCLPIFFANNNQRYLKQSIVSNYEILHKPIVMSGKMQVCLVQSINNFLG